MSFFISDALADPAAGPSTAATPSSIFNSILLLVLFLLFMYFMMWRPQTRRMKAHQGMINALQAGDEVITNGGLLGTITQMEDSIISIAIAKNIIVKLQKSAIANVLPKGTIK